MEYAKKIEQRKWSRQPVQIPAQYFIKNQSAKYQDCTVITISRNGAAIQFPGYESFKSKVAVFLDIIVPKTFQRLSLRGELKTKYRDKAGLIGGIQFTSVLPEDTFCKLTDPSAAPW